MVEVMAAAGFFRWLCMLLAKAVHYRTRALFITFMIMSFGLAMLIDRITVILFLAAVSIELVSVFVTGDKEHFDLSESEAYTKMRRHDRTRKQYHNRHSEGKWGDATYYDMCINSSPLGIEKTVNVLENYVKERTGNQEL